MAVRRSASLVGLLVASATFLAGCIEYNDPVGVAGDALEEAAAPVWSVVFNEGCFEAGFVAPYNMQEGEFLVDPLVRADIREELDDPMLVSTGRAEGGPITGNWHQGFQCPVATQDGEVTENFIWGWVGQAIEAPAWDPGGADLHVYTTGFGLANGTIRDSLLEASMLDITHTYEARVDYYGDNVVYEVMKDLPKGVYESMGTVQEYREVPERTIRMWWLVPTDGSRSPLGRFHAEDIPVPGAAPADDHAMDVEALDWHPVYVDIQTGGGTQWVSPDAVNHACHGGVAQHGPQGMLCVPEVTLLYEHASLALAYGGVFKDVVLPDFYFH